MKTLLIIQGYGRAQERIRRHWPWYLRAGCDILGIDRIDGRVHWPSERLIGVCQSGWDTYVQGANLVNLLIDCFRIGLTYYAYSDFCVIENDSIFLDKLPEHPGSCLNTCIGGYQTSGFRAKHFFHTPWWADRPTAELIVRLGERLVAAELIERGFPDRWLGLLCDLYPEFIRWRNDPAFWSVNDVSVPPTLIECAREAIARGTIYIHGIKTPEQLEAVTK